LVFLPPCKENWIPAPTFSTNLQRF
jgi:hypothetical protein